MFTCKYELKSNKKLNVYALTCLPMTAGNSFKKALTCCVTLLQLSVIMLQYRHQVA